MVQLVEHCPVHCTSLVQFLIRAHTTLWAQSPTGVCSRGNWLMSRSLSKSIKTFLKTKLNLKIYILVFKDMCFSPHLALGISELYYWRTLMYFIFWYQEELIISKFKIAMTMRKTYLCLLCWYLAVTYMKFHIPGIYWCHLGQRKHLMIKQ